jgi:hypothetical protein
LHTQVLPFSLYSGGILKAFFIFLFLGFLQSLPAKAGVQIEPNVGYWSGSISQELNSDIATKGIFYGAKLGLAGNQWKFGLDYLMGSGSGNQGGSTGPYDLSAYGPYLGFGISRRFQIYGTYFINVNAELQKEKNPNDFTGTGYRIGIGGFGWGGLDFLSINVEYISRTYNEYNNIKLSNELEEKAIGVSISIPWPSGGSFSGGSSSSSSGN